MPATVLVVEDEVLLLGVIAQELEDEGFVVMQSESAEQALVIIESGVPVDILFTDIRLPGMNGLRLAEHVQRLRPDLPILYATGYTDQNTQGIESSCFFRKPYRISLVLQKIRSSIAA